MCPSLVSRVETGSSDLSVLHATSDSSSPTPELVSQVLLSISTECYEPDRKGRVHVSGIPDDSCDDSVLQNSCTVDAMEPDLAPEVINNDGDQLVFVTPATVNNRRVHVYNSCYAGTCSCLHVLEGERAQLKPCRFATLIFQQDFFLSNLFENLVDGVPIVDSEPDTYICENYRSILDDSSAEKMTAIVKSELDEGMIAKAMVPPHCIHA